MLNFKKYRSETDGNVAMMFAVTTLMLLTGVGAAIDYSNMTRAKNMLQAQVDAGVLAAATVDVGDANNENQSRRAREEAANKVIAANGFDLNGYDPQLTVNENTVVLKANLDYQLFFGGLLGMENIRLEAIAESGLPGADGVDIVLVLDNTESMSVNGKMEALKEGAVNLVEAIEASDSESKIGIVPFARYVRVDDSFRTASWLDVPAEYDTPQTWTVNVREGGTCTDETQTRTIDGVEQEYLANVCSGGTIVEEERSGVKESRWEGCVGTRTPPFSETDNSYSQKIPGLLNVVPLEVSGTGYNVESYCPAAMTELTNSYDELRDNIQRMWTTDNTYLPIGLAWGQRVLSPGVPFDNVPESGQPENRKVMVLMTDGENTTEIDQGSLAVSELRSPPYISNIAEDAIATAANAATLRACDNAKAAGTEIYTIAFQVTDGATRTLLRRCASSNENAMTADSNAALIDRFERLASALEADIRLMR